MPKHYSMGDRAPAAPPADRPLGPAPKSLRERVGALRNLPPFLKLVWQTNPALTLAQCLLRLIRALLPVATLYVGKLIIDEVVVLTQTANAPDNVREWLARGLLDRIGWLLAIEFGLAVLSDVLGRTVSLFDSLLSEQFSNATSLRLMEHAATLDLEDFEDSELQDRLERARRQAAGRMTLMGQLFAQAQDVVTIASFAAGLVVYAPWLIVLLAIALVPAFIGEAHFNAQTYSLNYARTPERRELDYVRQTGASVETAKEVKIFGLNAFLIDRYRALATSFFEANRGSGEAARGRGQRADGDRHDRLLRRVRVHRLAHAAPRVHDRRPHVSRRLVPPPAHAARKPADGILAGRGPGAVSRRPVLVLRDPAGDRVAAGCAARSVADSRRVHVRGCRLPLSGRRPVGGAPPRSSRCNAGEVLALVGENGAGKTTLVKLLARLYDPDEGRILLDGHDLREYDLFALRSNIGVIFQDFVRYHLTAAENIAVGRIEARDDRARIVQAAQRSLADEVIAKLPNGYDQVIGKRFRTGIDLSGGEWQKIAIARAYMRDAQVLILDEPTAALDARSEFEVFQRFKELSHGKTAVLISHRFSSVRMADRIVVLADGTVEAVGTHDELLAAGGRYAELFELQAAGYR